MQGWSSEPNVNKKICKKRSNVQHLKQVKTYTQSIVISEEQYFSQKGDQESDRESNAQIFVLHRQSVNCTNELPSLISLFRRCHECVIKVNAVRTQTYPSVCECCNETAKDAFRLGLEAVTQTAGCKSVGPYDDNYIRPVKRLLGVNTRNVYWARFSAPQLHSYRYRLQIFPRSSMRNKQNI